MKKTLLYLSLCAIFALSACSQAPSITTPDDTLTVQPSDILEPSEPEEPSGQQLEQPVEPMRDTYFDRTAIILRQDVLEGTFTETYPWAQEYVAKNHPGFSMSEPIYKSGFAAPESLFADSGMSAHSSIWTMQLISTDGQTTELDIQLIYFSQGEKLYLSGILTGEDMLESKPEVYDYLRLDPRYQAVMLEFPPLIPPSDVLQASDFTAPEQAASPEAIAFGDYIAYVQDGSLYIEQDGKVTLIEQGNTASASDADMQAVTECRIFAALDDYRLVYYQQGYEWVNFTAVYDARTGISTKLPLGENLSRRVIAVSENHVYTVSGEMGAPLQLAVSDLDTMQTEPIFRPESDFSLYYFQFSADGTELATVTENLDENMKVISYTVQIYLPLEKRYVFTWEIDAASGYINSLTTDENGNFVLLFHLYETDTQQAFILP